MKIGHLDPRNPWIHQMHNSLLELLAVSCYTSRWQQRATKPQTFATQIVPQLPLGKTTRLILLNFREIHNKPLCKCRVNNCTWISKHCCLWIQTKNVRLTVTEERRAVEGWGHSWGGSGGLWLCFEVTARRADSHSHTLMWQLQDCGTVHAKAKTLKEISAIKASLWLRFIRLQISD